jgi:hypothetical protein
MADLEKFREETRGWLQPNCLPEMQAIRQGDRRIPDLKPGEALA